MEEFEPKVKTKILTKDFIARYAYIFVLAILLVGGISYGYTFFTENRKIASGSITTANLTINFGNREINATNLSVPTTDQEGINEYSKSLTITNETAVDGKFELTLTRDSGLELTDMRYASIVNGAIQEIDDVPSDGEMLSSAIMGNETTNVEIRLWPKTTYSGSATTFVGELEAEISYLGTTAASISSPAGKYVNFNVNEVWQIVKIEDGRLVLTRQTDYSGADSRTNSNRYNSSLTFNDNSMITSVSTDNKNVYLAKTVKINGGSGTLADPYTLVNNDFREPDKKVIAVITYKEDTTTVGTQNIYYNETNIISQVINSVSFDGWTDGTNNYALGDTITFSVDTVLTAIMAARSTLSSEIMAKCNDSTITYVEMYDTANGAPIDTPDGSGNEDVCFYTTTSTDRNSDAEQNSNVIFGDYCWQIVRTTADGGVKLLYNGPKTSDDKCTSDATSDYSSNPRPSAVGILGSYGNGYTAISGEKLYGTSFETFTENGTRKFRLKNTFTANWNGDYDNDGELDYPRIIGNYVCGTTSAATGTSDTCELLYYVVFYIDSTHASTEKYNVVTNSTYSRIGTSTFTAEGASSPANVGYMYNDVYSVNNFLKTVGSSVITRSGAGGSYYYGDEAVWVTDHYELRMNGVTPTSTTLWSSIRNNMLGLYTCLSSTSTSCTSVHYIVANSSNSYMFSVLLSNNETKDKTATWHYGTSVTKVGNTYTLMDGNNPSTLTKTFKLADWYSLYNSSSFKNIYVCDDFTSTSCTAVRYIKFTSNYTESHYLLDYTFKFANDITYDTTTHEYKYDTSKPISSDIYGIEPNNSSLDNTHYYCPTYDASTNSCGANNPIYYVTYANSYSVEDMKGIILTDGSKVSDALESMLSKYVVENNQIITVNKYNSAIKGIIDYWYYTNLASLGSYLDNNAVFCNDRSITDLGGWSTTGSIANSSYLLFKYDSSPTKTTATLGCSNLTDRFSVANVRARLTYPIGLLTESERAMMGSGFARTGNVWWVSSPAHFLGNVSYSRSTDTSGESYINSPANYSDVRPAIVLKPGVLISDGDGTYNNPYIVDTTNN